MGRLRLSPAAKGDLDKIWVYTAENWSIEQAEFYVTALGRALTLLADSPRLGRSINPIRSGYFKFPIASHLIYYRISSDGIDVIRILHKNMDAESHL